MLGYLQPRGCVRGLSNNSPSGVKTHSGQNPRRDNIRRSVLAPVGITSAPTISGTALYTVIPLTSCGLSADQNQSSKPLPHRVSPPTVSLGEERSQGGIAIPQHLRGAGPRRSSHGHLKEYFAVPCTRASTIHDPRSHLHHADSANAGTINTPTPQERGVLGGDMGASTALSLPAKAIA